MGPPAPPHEDDCRVSQQLTVLGLYVLRGEGSFAVHVQPLHARVQRAMSPSRLLFSRCVVAYFSKSSPTLLPLGWTRLPLSSVPSTARCALGNRGVVAGPPPSSSMLGGCRASSSLLVHQPFDSRLSFVQEAVSANVEDMISVGALEILPLIDPGEVEGGGELGILCWNPPRGIPSAFAVRRW